jgi:hypothetical protein
MRLPAGAASGRRGLTGIDGGFATGGEHDYLGMVVATEELTKGTLRICGSLILCIVSE